jgi:hypothetical protein
MFGFSVAPFKQRLRVTHHNSHLSNFQRDDCVDFMKVVCCTLCVIAQDGRELKNHGRRSRHH